MKGSVMVGSSDEGESDAVIGVMREKVMTVMEGSLR